MIKSDTTETDPQRGFYSDQNRYHLITSNGFNQLLTAIMKGVAAVASDSDFFAVFEIYRYVTDAMCTLHTDVLICQCHHHQFHHRRDTKLT